MCAVDLGQFRLEDYKLKLAHLNAQADRMWSRFNYFVTIQAGLVGLFAIASSKQFTQRAPWAILAEVIISLTWWMVGARDRFLWRAGRRSVEKAANALLIESRHLPSYKAVGRELGYIPVGELDPFAAEMHDEAIRRYRTWDIRMRFGHLLGEQGDTDLGVTVIPMLVPLCATAFWWAAFVVAVTTRSADGWLSLLALPLVVALLWLLVSLVLDVDRPPPADGGNGDGNGDHDSNGDRHTALLLCALLLIVGLSAVAIAVAHGLHGALASLLFALIAVSLLLAIVALVFLLASNWRLAVAATSVLLGLTLTVTLSVKPSLSLDGTRGLRGFPGHNGHNGHNGTDGTDGTNGHRGPQGKEGKRGKRGPKGDPGLPGPWIPPDGS